MGRKCAMRNFIIYSLTNVSKMTKPRTMNWAENIARMEEKIGAYMILVG
jgi:hypothetical protein